MDGTRCGVQELKKGLSPAQPRNVDLFDYCDAAPKKWVYMFVT